MRLPQVARLLRVGLFTLGTLAPTVAPAATSRPKVVAEASFVEGLIAAPVPKYPEEAARKSWNGVGVFELRFRRDGTVADVSVELSTGHRLLDETTRESLLQWRCQPGAQDTARMAMTFTSGRGPITVSPPDEETVAKKKSNLSSAPRPTYPYEARRLGEGGYGVFVIRFEGDGTASRVVTLHSTGSPRIDSQCLKDLLRWRCRPGVYTTILVPINFSVAKRSRGM